MVDDVIRGPPGDRPPFKVPAHPCVVPDRIRDAVTTGSCAYDIFRRVLDWTLLQTRLGIWNNLDPTNPRLAAKQAKLFPGGVVPRGDQLRRFVQRCEQAQWMDEEMRNVEVWDEQSDSSFVPSTVCEVAMMGSHDTLLRVPVHDALWQRKVGVIAIKGSECAL